MIVPMCKLQVVTLDEPFDRLVQGLQQLGYLHLEPVAVTPPALTGALQRMQLSEADRQRRELLAAARHSLDEVRASLGPLPTPQDAPAGPPREPAEILALAVTLLHRVRALRRRRRNLDRDGRILRSYLGTGPPLPPHGQAPQILLLTAPSADRLVFQTLRARLRKLTPQPRWRLYRLESGPRLAIVACSPSNLPAVRQAAWQAGALEVQREAAASGGPETARLNWLQAEVDALPRRRDEQERAWERLRRQAAQSTAALERQCLQEAQRLDAKSSFAEGALLRVLHAFVPADKKDEVLRRAAELTAGQVETAELELGPRPEDVPVVLHNPGFARPFELLLGIFPPPTYGSLDPTIVNAVGVPLLFGLIVGDIAYGAILLGAACWLRWRYRHQRLVHAAGTIGMYCAASAICFGFLYGELFGSLGHWLGLPPLVRRDRPEDLIWLLKMAVAVGVTHVGLGLCLGLRAARRVADRQVFHERLGQLLCLSGAVLLACGLWLGQAWWLAGAALCLIVGGAVLLCGAGVAGLLEVFSLAGNILSYSRLMALGAASVILALVANRLFARLDYGLSGLLMAAALHGLNIVIAAFSPTIHTLRLHYVEFFTKFYRPEGRDYVPFGVRSGFLEQG